MRVCMYASMLNLALILKNYSDQRLHPVLVCGLYIKLYIKVKVIDISESTLI
jgi:hypothetical protein